MSVEEARKRVEQSVQGHCDEYHAGDPCDCAKIIDRLILEVRAEMPCYYPALMTDNSTFTCTEFKRDQDAHSLCPSCEARAELAQAAHPTEAV